MLGFQGLALSLWTWTLATAWRRPWSLSGSHRPAPTPETAMTSRRPDIDALRVLACYLLFPFHAGRVFDDQFYHLKALAPVAELSWLTAFLHCWHMPLFLFVAGWAAAGMLTQRGPGAFLRDRAWRLLPPLLLGILVAVPLIKYVELSQGIDLKSCGPAAAGWFQESFWTHYIRFFSHLRRFSWSHLWFLVYLLLYTLLLLPLLLRINRTPVQQGGGWSWLTAPLLGLGLVELVLRPWFGDYPNLYRDWANHLSFCQFFLLGALAARHPGFDLALTRQGPWLGLAGVLAGVWVASGWGPLEARLLVRPLAAWGCVAGLYGLFRHRVPASPRLLGLADASIAIYVLHHPILVLVAAWVLTLPVGPWLGFVLIALLAWGLTQGVYGVLVQRQPWVRRALGMNPNPRVP